MNIPSDLLYSKDHEWVKVEGEMATIGITDFAQQELGDIVYVEIETEGDSLAAEAVFGTVEAVKNRVGFIHAHRWRYNRIQCRPGRHSRGSK